MAHSNFRSHSWRSVASILLAVAGSQSPASATLAQPRHQPEEFPAKSLQARDFRASTGAIDGVFQSRWPAGAAEYAAGPDGKVRTVQNPLEDDPDVADVNGRNIDTRSHFHLASIENGPRCAASPLTTSETARLVVEAARKYRVDPDFAVAIAASESRLDRYRNSPKGARGPMQLMPSTAAFLGVADICDPAQNIDAGVRLLGSLFKTYRNPLVVAAAYNAGEANVRKYRGIPPFSETVRFVAEVADRLFDLPALGVRNEKAGVEPTPDDTVAPGVLTPGKPRQWVGGVMQF